MNNSSATHQHNAFATNLAQTSSVTDVSFIGNNATQHGTPKVNSPLLNGNTEWKVVTLKKHSKVWILEKVAPNFVSALPVKVSTLLILLPETFTVHEFIALFIQQYSTDYEAALKALEGKTKCAPHIHLHLFLATELSKPVHNVEKLATHAMSRNSSNKKTVCSIWRKR